MKIISFSSKWTRKNLKTLLAKNILGIVFNKFQHKSWYKKLRSLTNKSFCTAKETINKTKRQPIKWEKTSANNISYKGLIYKTYKEPIQLNNLEKTMKNGYLLTLIKKHYCNDINLKRKIMIEGNIPKKRSGRIRPLLYLSK